MQAADISAADSKSASERIAAFASSFDMSALGPSQIVRIRNALLDTLSVAIAGKNEPASLIAQRYAGGMSDGSRGARLWSTGERTSLEGAALANGVLGHVLDYDDVTSIVRGHISVVLLPAIVALAEVERADGRALAVAYAVGFEVMCRLARSMVGDHYVKGWHSTATLGTLAATAACANLLHLNQEQTTNALALAVAQVAGTRQNFGSMAKSFQAGHCGAAALRAVGLARLDFTGAASAIDGPLGFMRLYAKGEDLRQQMDSLGTRPLELESAGIEVKKYPMCYAAHRALDGILELRAEHGFDLDKVASLRVATSSGGLAPLVHHRPQTGLDAKFSMEYAMAAALADGRIGLASFDDGAVRRPEIQAFFPRVTAIEATGSLFPRWTKLDVELKDGSVVTRRIDRLHGAADSPLTPAELHAKAQDCFAYGRSGQGVEQFMAVLDRFPGIAVEEIVSALL